MSSSMQNAAYSLTLFNTLKFFHIVIFGAQNSHVMAVPLFFRCYNEVATKFNLPQFFTRGSHSKIYLRWHQPTLQSQEQCRLLKPNAPSLDVVVKNAMIKALGDELMGYVGEIELSETKASPPQSDSTSASAGSLDSAEDDDLAYMRSLRDEIQSIIFRA